MQLEAGTIIFVALLQRVDFDVTTVSPVTCHLSPTDAVAAHYEYAPFGALIVSRGEDAAANPWRFSSEYAEGDTTTVYYNYRHYEPVTGRWMARDGLGEMGGLGLYIFVGNCTSYFDLLGLDGLALNAPTRIESPQEDQPKVNPQRVLELGGSSAIRVVDIYMTLGITDPVVSYELICVCTNSKYHIVGSVDLTVGE